MHSLWPLWTGSIASIPPAPLHTRLISVESFLGLVQEQLCFPCRSQRVQSGVVLKNLGRHPSQVNYFCATADNQMADSV